MLRQCHALRAAAPCATLRQQHTRERTGEQGLLGWGAGPRSGLASSAATPSSAGTSSPPSSWNAVQLLMLSYIHLLMLDER